jgi:hypothetical protein
MSLTKKVVQKFTYSKNIYNLIDSFITIPKYQVKKNKDNLIKELDDFSFWLLEDVYKGDDCFEATTIAQAFDKDILDLYYDNKNNQKIILPTRSAFLLFCLDLYKEC